MAALTWNQLNKQIQKKIDNSLKNEVTKIVKETEIKHINSDVYNSYNPVVYERRGTNGGLGDINNIESTVKDGILTVINSTPPNDSYYGVPYDTSNKTALSEWVEYGLVPNIWNDQNYVWENSRPFTSNTIKELEQSGKHISALKKGLERNNLKVD